MVSEEDLRLGEKRLLEVNNRLILPTDVTLRFVISSADVLHSWSIPEMGIKMDAVPGRLNQFITLICKPGIYYGQCSELCGVAHGFMPIVVHAVPYDVFIKYLG
jgi:heme/copper-type cytochrome/quinol oxidase subunit 2